MKQFRQFRIFSGPATGLNPKTGDNPGACRYICHKHTPGLPAMSIILIDVFCIQICSTYRPAKIRQAVSRNELRQNRATVFFCTIIAPEQPSKVHFLISKFTMFLPPVFLRSLNKPTSTGCSASKLFYYFLLIRSAFRVCDLFFFWWHTSTRNASTILTGIACLEPFAILTRSRLRCIFQIFGTRTKSRKITGIAIFYRLRLRNGTRVPQKINRAAYSHGKPPPGIEPG